MFRYGDILNMMTDYRHGNGVLDGGGTNSRWETRIEQGGEKAGVAGGAELVPVLRLFRRLIMGPEWRGTLSTDQFGLTCRLKSCLPSGICRYKALILRVGRIAAFSFWSASAA